MKSLSSMIPLASSSPWHHSYLTFNKCGPETSLEFTYLERHLLFQPGWVNFYILRSVDCQSAALALTL